MKKSSFSVALAALLAAGTAQAQLIPLNVEAMSDTSEASAQPLQQADQNTFTVQPSSAQNDWTGFYLGGQFGSGNFTATAGDLEGSVSGRGLGYHLGYAHDLGQFVLGAEITSTVIWADAQEDPIDDGVVHFKLIAGFDAGRALPYVTIGAASYVDTYYGETSSGSMTGIGVDFMLSDKVTMGIEYSNTVIPDFAGYSDIDVDIDMLVVRAAYRF